MYKVLRDHKKKEKCNALVVMTFMGQQHTELQLNIWLDMLCIKK